MKERSQSNLCYGKKILIYGIEKDFNNTYSGQLSATG